jgi:hypothetical protein
LTWLTFFTNATRLTFATTITFVAFVSLLTLVSLVTLRARNRKCILFRETLHLTTLLMLYSNLPTSRREDFNRALVVVITHG